MSFESYVAIGVGLFLAAIVGFIAYKRFPRRLKHDYFVTKWKKLQDRCPDEAQWALALSEADDLLNEALKKKRFKGHNMGERLVTAQKDFTNNDAVWFGHKLRTRLDTNPEHVLTKEEVQKALFGLRQGLKDIGAL